ncbi:hypothetical protein GJ744_000762 [Endocarpon pusillum]|uniref:NACHT domain-containing protein n=1 Tax=Endocarpon pusillum TaxID=364733 RepID=A0A8H7E1M0_9EURO|nr:hypothetical protein GJ744_000762 [Endocarpon pusillum]
MNQEMSGSKPTPSKVSWRQKFRQQWSSKRSPSLPAASNPLTLPTSALTPNATLMAVVPAASNAGPVSGSSAKNPTSAPLSSPSTFATAHLLQNALHRLKDEERTTVERHISLASTDIQSAVQGAVNAVNNKRQACLDNRWSCTLNGRKVILREKADKVVYWLDRFKSVGDVVANADPIHIGLPWAGIRLLLEAAVAESNQMAALLIGCETILYMASRLQVYIEFWYHLPPEATRNNLEESLAMMYAHVLHFLARAILVYESSAIRRAFSALWKTDDVVKFEEKGSNLAIKVENDASNCHRAINAQQQEIVSQLQQDMQKVLAELQQHHQLQASLDHLHLKIDIDKIPYAKGAIFNSADNAHTLCHPATRTDILAQVQQWAQLLDGKSIFWLYGGAGTGKSTISWTFSQWLTDQEGMGGVELGASFFFKRGEGDRGSGIRFFPTIIRQLIKKIAGLDALVANIIDSDPFIFDKAIAEQFRRLVQQPLQDSSINGANLRTLIVVVDALDECQNEKDIRLILELWSKLLQITKINLRLFLTSRYEPSIWPVFQNMSVDIFRDIDLVDAVPLSTIRQDLSVYLNDSLASIRKDYNDRLYGTFTLQSDWADSEKIQQLVEMAVPLFIVAATLCRHIEDRRHDPQEKLQRILQNRTTGHMSQMELTYRPVLEHLTDQTGDDGSQEELCRNFRSLVGSIVVLAEPLSKRSLETLLGMSLQSIGQQLASLHSVLRIPADQDTPIRTLHLSFAEFLLSEKAQGQSFGVNGPNAHLALSRHCLRVLSNPRGLRENICDLEWPGQSRHKIESTTIADRLSPALQYACRHWVHHVQHSHRQIHDDDEVHIFLKKHFLHWLEVLSLTDYISETISFLGTLQSCVSVVASDLSAFLEDARRFILTYRYIVDRAPLQLYSSAIIFAPQTSLVRNICGRPPTWIQQYPKTPVEWGLELQKLEGHSDWVRAVTFSPDGALLASGSDDQMIRLWDTQTGREVQKLEGHSNLVSAVAFSPDGAILASGSNDQTIRLWDTQTGQEVQKLEGHSDKVSAVAFSPDGAILASGSDDQTIRLWDIQTGQEVQKLEGHSNLVSAVAFSPGGALLASGSDDQTIRLWDMQTGQEVQKLEGHFNIVRAVAFSPDGAILASGSDDHTIRLWDIQMGQEVQKLEGHSSLVRAIAFSLDNAILASGSSDHTIRLWDTQTGQEVQKLEGHSDWVRAVTFSPDSALLASGSDDQMIRLWDTQTGREVQKLERHSDKVSIIVFSPDGVILASGSSDQMIRLWDTQTGQEVQKLEGHFSIVRAVAFSPDGAILASGSDDYTIRLWDIQMGQEVQKLEGHSSLVRAIAFSLDNAILASGSSDHTIRLWDTQTGQEVQKLEGHSDWVRAVTFSPDSALLASGSDDRMIRLWDTQTGREVQKLERHSGWVRAVAFSPDGAVLASGSDDRTIRLWDTQTGQILKILENIPTPRTICFTNNNMTLVTDKGTFNADGNSFVNADDIQACEDKTINVSDNWIRRGNQNLLWLPHEYRGSPDTIALNGDKIAIGAESGLVSIFGFKSS